MKTLLYWLSGHLPCRIISDGDKPYLERYYLFTLLGVRFYLHRFVASDPDRGMHNHPWRWAFSMILSGWYYEQTNYGVGTVRWFNGLTGDTFHRVILPTDHGVHECWTLFAHRAANAKGWGFLRDFGQLGSAYLPHRHPGGAPTEWWNQVPIGRLERRRMPR